MSLSKQNFYINSRDRLSGTDSDFTYRLTSLQKDNNFTHATVLQAQIPKSYYLVQSGSNTFTLDEGTTATVTITPGNYTRRNFQTTIQSLLRTASPNGWTYTVTYNTNPEIAKFVFSVTGNGGVQPSFVFTDYCYELLGFDKNSTNAFVADTLTSTNVIKIEREDVLQIHCDMITNGNDSILQEVYASGTYSFASLVFQNPDPIQYSKKIAFKNGNVIRIQLTNEDGQVMNLNGLNMNISLLLFEERSESIKRELAKIWGNQQQ